MTLEDVGHRSPFRHL